MFETITFSSDTYEVMLTVTPETINRAVEEITDYIYNPMYEDSFEYFIAVHVSVDDDGDEIPETEIDYLIDAAYRDVSEEVQDKIRRLMRRSFLTKMDEAWEDTFDN